MCKIDLDDINSNDVEHKLQFPTEFKKNRLKFFIKQIFRLDNYNVISIVLHRVVPDLMTVHRSPNATHWNMEDGYDSNANNSNSYPFRVFSVGYDGMVNIALQTFVNDFDSLCMAPAQGFLIAFHSPDQFPRIPSDFITIPFNQVAFISIKPNMITTSDGLRSYLPQERGCLFKAERQLRYFRSYSQRNCEIECLTNYTKKECGCTQFWMPSE